MAMLYLHSMIDDAEIPPASTPLLQHLVETYAIEINKVGSVWSAFTDADLDWRPHARSSSVHDILKHQLLSERRFMGEFLGLPEPLAANVLPFDTSVQMYHERLLELAKPRLRYLAEQGTDWWLERVPFFDVRRERIWIFWRRVLHTAHHRTQLTTYLRLLDRPVPSTYGPTADVTWEGADPTNSVDAASRG